MVGYRSLKQQTITSAKWKMFILVSIEDKIKVNPDLFDQDLTEVLLQQIEMKYVNKILVNVGLCVCFYDFIEVGDPYIYPAEGCAHQRAKFRLAVFRPFVGEIIVGKVILCREDGIKVSMEFFDDITIPTHLLQAPSEYHPKLKQWIWKFSEDESNPVEFAIQVGDKIRFRIRTITFAALTSTVKGTTATVTTESQLPTSTTQSAEITGSSSHVNIDEEIPAAPQAIRKRSTSFDIAKNTEPPAAMQIIGSINEDGLGLPSWWD